MMALEYDDLPPITGEEFRRLREHFDITQEQAAILLNMSGKSQVSRMERKKLELVPAKIVKNFAVAISEKGGPGHYALDAIERIRETMKFEDQLNSDKKKKEIPMEEENYSKHLNNEIKKAEQRNDVLESRNYNLEQSLQDERIKNMQVVREVDHLKFQFESFKADINNKFVDAMNEFNRLMDSKIEASKSEMKAGLLPILHTELDKHTDEIQQQIDPILDEIRDANESQAKGLNGFITDTPGVPEFLKSIGASLGPTLAPLITDKLSNLANSKRPQQTATPSFDPNVMGKVHEEMNAVAEDDFVEDEIVDVFEEVAKNVAGNS